MMMRWYDDDDADDADDDAFRQEAVFSSTQIISPSPMIQDRTAVCVWLSQ